jgi:hypothetical protein
MPLGLGFRSEPVHPVDGSTAHMMGADLASVSADRADRETINLPGDRNEIDILFPRTPAASRKALCHSRRSVPQCEFAESGRGGLLIRGGAEEAHWTRSL